MNKTIKQISYLLIFIILTLVTQIGGVIFLLSVFLSKQIKRVIKLQGANNFYHLIFILNLSYCSFYCSLFWKRSSTT